jgi:malate dehydrogenase (oxaloacetate-decarboxylating)(NADP+)
MENSKNHEALKYHKQGRPGKIQVVPTKPHSTQRDLALAYSPGVAIPCLEIEKDLQCAYDYTAKGNLVAVISNGTAVLGLGDIGALAGKPVMEGKGLLFKIFADIDVFDIEVDEKDPDKFIEVVRAISPTFGGINLEDIKAPECFEIEEKLKEMLDIPLMHDDQHGTAIISGAGLINALEIVGKKIEDVQIVVNGAGASASACSLLYIRLGADPKKLVMVDSKGVISTRRTDLNSRKKPFATDLPCNTLEEAVAGADVFLGLSVEGCLTQDMVRSMADNPIVFACANPNPEISYADAIASRPDIVFATGRSDHPNQVNNVLGFPYIFRGALDVRSTGINEEMKIAAVRAIAELAKKPVPDVVTSAYNTTNLSFGRQYIIPKPLDPRLLITVAPAVAKAAMETGIARKPIKDWDKYAEELRLRMGLDNKLVRGLVEKAKENPKRVVFAEANHINMLKAAADARAEGICIPILLGNEERIEKLIKKHQIELDDVEIVNLRHDRESHRRKKYAKAFTAKRQREGMTYDEAIEKMFDRNYFGMMMVESGDADAFITGVYTKYQDAITPAIEIVGMRDGLNHIAGLNIVTTKLGTFFFADTMVNNHPSKETMIDIAKLAHDSVKLFNIDPVMAMLSYSNFGERNVGSPAMIHDAVEYLHKNNPEMMIDGEMQVNFALNKDLRHEKFPFSKIDGMNVNTLIFPNLSSSSIAYKLMLEIGMSDTIGPIQMGLKKPIHILNVESSVRDILNMVTIAVVDAQFEELKQNQSKQE